MRITAAFPVSLALEQIDMRRWVTEMTTEDYASFTPAHMALGSYHEGPRFFMANVECIGFDMLVQHYELMDHSRSHVRFYSRETRAYVLRWFPVTCGVPWEMTLRRTSSGTCELTCTIGAEFDSSLLRVVAWVGGLGSLFLRRHLAAEGAAFARDLERKFAS